LISLFSPFSTTGGLIESNCDNSAAGVLFLGLAAGFATGYAAAKIRSESGSPAAVKLLLQFLGGRGNENPVERYAGDMAGAKNTCTATTARVSWKNGDGKRRPGGDMKLELKDCGIPNSLAKMTDGECVTSSRKWAGKMAGGEGDRTKEEVRWKSGERGAGVCERRMRRRKP